MEREEDADVECEGSEDDHRDTVPPDPDEPPAEERGYGFGV